MAGNTFGTLFKLTTFGESHGEALGGIIDGCPAGITIDFKAIQHELNRRKPGQSAIVTQRKEPDEVRFLSGIFEGKTTGASIGFIIENTNQKSHDYSHIKNAFSPQPRRLHLSTKIRHSGLSRWRTKFCPRNGLPCGGRSYCQTGFSTVRFTAYVSSVGKLTLNKPYPELDLSVAETNIVRCPDPEMAQQMEDYIKQIRKEGDTVGGVVSCVIRNVPIGLGEPVFDRLHAELGKAMLSINAVKGFEYGSGFAGTQMKGSLHNDLFNPDGSTQTNRSGGIQGGISNGMDIYFNVAFKPVATIMQTQDALTTDGNIVTMQGKGRHDPCVVPRAVPIVEAMAALVILDYYLIHKSNL